MKIKNLNIAFVIALVAGLGFTACTDDEEYDVEGNPDNLVYFNERGNVECSVVHTPVGEFGDVSAKLPVSILRAASENTSVQCTIDTSLVSVYNDSKGTDYSKVDPSIVTFVKTDVTIPEGSYVSRDSVEVVVDQTHFADFTEKNYLLPIRISTVTGDGKPSEERGMTYILITTSTRLAHPGITYDDMPGSEIPVGDMSGWTVAEGASISDVSDNGTWTGWSSGTYVIDMGSVRKVGGFSAQPFYPNWGNRMSSMSLDISEDGTNWVECGTEESGDLGSDGNGYYYFGLYGTVSGRYLRVTVRDSWGYGFSELRVFAE